MKYKATIAIPAFNVEKFLSEAIESALNQTYRGNYEILIINDGSVDSTPLIAETFSESRSNVRILHQKNQGLGVTRNRLLEESKGNILFGLDGDDRLHPSALEKVMEFYEEHPEVGFVYTDNKCIDEDGKVLYEGRKAVCHEHFDHLIYFTHFPGHLRSFRKEKVKRMKFDSNLHHIAEDWDFLLKITPFVKKGHIPEILFDYRINTQGVSRTNSKNSKRNLTVQLLKKYINKHNLYPTAKNVEVKAVSKGDHAIHYEHIVDGVDMMNPKAREALEEYFLVYENPIGVNQNEK